MLQRYLSLISGAGRLILLVTVLAAAPLFGAAPPLKPGGGEFGEPRLLLTTAEGEERRHLSWPKIAKAEDGTLVLAYILSRSHHTEGAPAVSLSRDGGETFSSPRILRDFGVEKTPDYAHAANLALGRAENGDLICLAMAYTPNVSGGPRESRIFGWRSTDNGESWREVDTSKLDAHTGSVYGHVFRTEPGVLAVAGHYRPGSNNDVARTGGIWLSHSRDHGRSWERPRTISVSDDPLLEPAIWYASGRYWGLIRHNPAERYRLLNSADGETWEESVSPVGGGKRLPSPFIVADRYRENILYALHTERNPDGPEGYTYLWRKDTEDEGGWERTGRVLVYPRGEGRHHREGRDFGYPWMVQLDEHEWFLAFYYGRFVGRNDLWGMRLRPDGKGGANE